MPGARGVGLRLVVALVAFFFFLFLVVVFFFCFTLVEEETAWDEDLEDLDCCLVLLFRFFCGTGCGSKSSLSV